MKLIITLFISTLFSLSHARVGETAEQCQARYGEPHRIDHEARTISYNTAGFQIICFFNNDHCIKIIYRKANQNLIGDPDPITTAEKETLLHAHSNGADWQQSQVDVFLEFYTWQNLTAGYHTVDKILMIATIAQINKEDAARKAKEKEALKGF